MRRFLNDDEDAIRAYIGRRLRAARTQRKLSRERLASLTGISKCSIENWETGAIPMFIADLKLVCETLNITPNRLLGFEDDPQRQMDRPPPRTTH